MNRESRLYAGKRKLKLRLALEVVREGSLDHRAAEPAPQRGFHRRPTTLLPAHQKTSKPVDAGADLHPAAGIAERTVLRGIGDHLVDHQRATVVKACGSSRISGPAMTTRSALLPR
jgi:hypothetical protein